MGETLVISPEELYYLGRLLKAEYIDYAYIAAMRDIGGNFRLFSKESAAALTQRALLREDFSGNLEPDDDALRLLRPIFFGAAEMTVDLCMLQEEKPVSACKFHFQGDSAVMVHPQEEKLLIAETGRKEIMETIGGLVPKGEHSAKDGLSPAQAAGILVLKSVSLDGNAKRLAFALDAGGGLYREAGEDKLEAVTREEVLAAAEKMLEEM